MVSKILKSNSKKKDISFTSSPVVSKELFVIPSREKIPEIKTEENYDRNKRRGTSIQPKKEIKGYIKEIVK